MVVRKVAVVLFLSWISGHRVAAAGLQFSPPIGFVAYQAIDDVLTGVKITSCRGEGMLKLSIETSSRLRIEGRHAYMAIVNGVSEEVEYPKSIHEDSEMLPMPERFQDETRITGGEWILFAVKIMGTELVDKSISDDAFFLKMGAWIRGEDPDWGDLLDRVHVGLLKVEKDEQGRLKLAVRQKEVRTMQVSRLCTRNYHMTRYLSVNGVDFLDIIYSGQASDHVFFRGSKRSYAIIMREAVKIPIKLYPWNWSLESSEKKDPPVRLIKGDKIVVALAITQPMTPLEVDNNMNKLRAGLDHLEVGRLAFGGYHFFLINVSV